MTSSPDDVVPEPLSPNCQAALTVAQHAVLGLSPFNSYFSTPRIRALLAWAQTRFRAFHVFIPDEPAAFTLEALGYGRARARRKARRQANYLRNKVRRAAAVLPAPVETHELLLDWAALQRKPRFRAVHARVRRAFQDCANLRAECTAASAWVLKKRDAAELPAHRLGLAVEYLLAEMPLFVASPRILERTHSVFVYHEAPPILRRLYAGELSLRPELGQGFVVARQRTGAARL